MSLTRTASRDHVYVQRLCITGPVPWHSGELAPFLTWDAALGEQALCLTRLHSGADPGGRVMGELMAPKMYVSVGELAPSLI